MGMAASQARLLSITARVHDVEYKAQNIMNQKVALSTQKDELYQDYCDALDAKKLQVGYYGENGKLNFVDATFASVCEFNPDRAKTFMMTDSSSGKMVVSREMYDAYNNYKAASSGDKYGFAMEMLGFSAQDMQDYGDPETNNITIMDIGMMPTGDCLEVENNCFNGCGEYSNWFIDENGETNVYVLMELNERAVFESHKDDKTDKMTKLNSILTKLDNIHQNGGKKSEVSNLINEFRTKLYDAFAEEIYGKLKTTVENSPQCNSSNLKDWDSDMNLQFQYYAQIFEGIENAGGCIPIDEYCKDGDSGNEWFNNMVKAGKVILSEYNDSGTKKGTWSEVSIATSMTLQEVSDDKDLKKAEAKYNHELNVINRKETKFDQELNKLETERTALTKEMDSIKQVKDDNIERTFGIFS